MGFWRLKEILKLSLKRDEGATEEFQELAKMMNSVNVALWRDTNMSMKHLP